MDDQTKRKRHAALMVLFSPGFRLDPHRPSARDHVDLPQPGDPVWVAIGRELQLELRAEAEEVARHQTGDRVLVVTAGRPGSGKSTTLASLPGAASYCRISTDDIVERMVQKLLDGDRSQGRRPYLTELKNVQLPGGALMPLEAAPFLYPAATIVRDRHRRDTIAVGYSTVVDGTMTNRAAARTVLDELRQAEARGHRYDRVVGILTEAPDDVCAGSRFLRYSREIDQNELGPRLVTDPLSGPGTLSPSASMGFFVSLCRDLGYLVSLQTHRRDHTGAQVMPRAPRVGHASSRVAAAVDGSHGR